MGRSQRYVPRSGILEFLRYASERTGRTTWGSPSLAWHREKIKRSIEVHPVGGCLSAQELDVVHPCPNRTRILGLALNLEFLPERGQRLKVSRCKPSRRFSSEIIPGKTPSPLVEDIEVGRPL